MKPERLRGHVIDFQLLAAISTRVSACARTGRLYVVNYIEAIGFKLTPDSEFSMIKIQAGSGPRAEARKAEKIKPNLHPKSIFKFETLTRCKYSRFTN